MHANFRENFIIVSNKLCPWKWNQYNNINRCAYEAAGTISGEQSSFFYICIQLIRTVLISKFSIEKSKSDGKQREKIFCLKWWEHWNTVMATTYWNFLKWGNFNSKQFRNRIIHEPRFSVVNLKVQRHNTNYPDIKWNCRIPFSLLILVFVVSYRFFYRTA